MLKILLLQAFAISHLYCLMAGCLMFMFGEITFAQSSTKSSAKSTKKSSGKPAVQSSEIQSLQVPQIAGTSASTSAATSSVSTATIQDQSSSSVVRQNLPDTASIVKISIRTTIGVIEADLFRRSAPGTVENFLHYVIGGYYTGGFFHRTVKKDNQPDKPDSLKIEVIQSTIGNLYERYAMPPIALETTRETGVKHLDGTLSMARDEPNTAQYEFFICIGDQPQLDFGGHRNPDRQGFAAFGRVTKGMDIVRKIQQSRAAGQALTPPILIIGITRRS